MSLHTFGYTSLKTICNITILAGFSTNTSSNSMASKPAAVRWWKTVITTVVSLLISSWVRLSPSQYCVQSAPHSLPLIWLGQTSPPTNYNTWDGGFLTLSWPDTTSYFPLFITRNSTWNLFLVFGFNRYPLSCCKTPVFTPSVDSWIRLTIIFCSQNVYFVRVKGF